MKINKAALAAIIVVAGSTWRSTAGPSTRRCSIRCTSGPSKSSDRRQAGRQPQRPAGVPNLSREENAAILPLYQAVQAQDWATRAPPCRPPRRAPSPDARYSSASCSSRSAAAPRIWRCSRRRSMRCSRAAPRRPRSSDPARRPDRVRDRGERFRGAEAPVTRFVEANPTDVSRITQLAQIKVRLNKRPEALALYQRLQQTETGGQRAPGGSVPGDARRRL